MAAAREAKKERADLRENIKKIEPFFKPMAEPGHSDWLGYYNEPGQTFDQYLESEPTRPTRERHKIYVLPLGKFNAGQAKVIEVAAGYLAVFYDLPVERLPPKELKSPWPYFRNNRFTKTRQIKTGYILSDILKPSLPPTPRL